MVTVIEDPSASGPVVGAAVAASATDEGPAVTQGNGNAVTCTQNASGAVVDRARQATTTSSTTNDITVNNTGTAAPQTTHGGSLDASTLQEAAECRDPGDPPALMAPPALAAAEPAVVAVTAEPLQPSGATPSAVQHDVPEAAAAAPRPSTPSKDTTSANPTSTEAEEAGARSLMPPPPCSPRVGAKPTHVAEGANKPSMLSVVPSSRHPGTPKSGRTLFGSLSIPPSLGPGPSQALLDSPVLLPMMTVRVQTLAAKWSHP